MKTSSVRGKMAVKRDPEDIAFSNAIRESYDYTCYNCGFNGRHDTRQIHCAHVHTRKHRATRWCADFGAVCLCAKCHRRFTDFPVEWGDFLRERWGDKHYDEAKSRAWSVCKLTSGCKEAIAKHYREEVKRIEKLRAEGETGIIKLINYERE